MIRSVYARGVPAAACFRLAASHSAVARFTTSRRLAAAPRGKLPWWYSLVEGSKDVLSVTFGVSRARNVEAEIDAGLRAYPWIEYEDPTSPGTLLYRNNDTGAIIDTKPEDFDERAPPEARVVINREANALTVVNEAPTAWARTLSAVASSPIISSLLAVGEVVAASPVGAQAAKVKQAVGDKVEDLREAWETSQHPLVVNAAYAVDSMMSETEHGRAIREIQLLDAGFDQYTFIEEMTHTLIPTVVKAFFKMDMPVLKKMCKDTALAQMKAVSAARNIEGITMDGTILNVQKVELVQAKSLEHGLPIILVSSQVQYIHCVRNAKGEVTEGSDSEIRAAFFILAVTREADPATGELGWRVVEMTMMGSQLYL